MTPAQLELRRLRELLRAARKARHLVHAMRTPLARVVRFERAAAQVWNRAVEKLERVNPDHGFELAEPDDLRERVARLSNLADALAKDEARAVRRIEALSKSRRIAAKPRPIEQRIAARRKARAKATGKRAQFESEHAEWEERVKAVALRWLARYPNPRVVRWLEDVASDARKNDAMHRAAVRQFGDSAAADELLALAEKEPRP